MTFGEKLQFLRKQRGMSQEQLATQLTISRQSISKWELDSSLPDTEKVIQLSKFFAVTTDYLLNDDIENNNDIPDEQENTAMLECKFHNVKKTVFASICAGVGCLGNITLFVLSAMIQIPVTKKRILPDGSAEYYGGGDVLGYSFTGFIEKYNLQALFIIFIILTVVGIIAIIKISRTQKTLHMVKINK